MHNAFHVGQEYLCEILLAAFCGWKHAVLKWLGQVVLAILEETLLLYMVINSLCIVNENEVWTENVYDD